LLAVIFKTNLPLVSNESKAIRTTWFSIIGNTAIAIIKWIAGYLGNSYGLIADAIESTSDILASLLALVGLTYSAKPADENHPYGHGKAEPMMTFVVVAFLVISAVIIIYQSIVHIFTPHDLPESYTLYILGGIIVIKEFFYRVVSRRSRETKSSLLKADAWHHRSDAITSVTVFIGIGIALIFGKGYETADDWAALVAGGIILYNSYLIFRPALGEIMDEHFYDDLIADIRKVAGKVDGVLGTEKCFVRKSGLKYFVDLHAIVDADITVKEGHDIARKLRVKIINEYPEISDVLVHIEPAD
jgi:cation diffusion facilitator family transporter